MPNCFRFCPMRLIPWRSKSSETKKPVILYNVCHRCEWCIENYDENNVNTHFGQQVNSKSEAMRAEFVEQLNRLKLTTHLVINLLNDGLSYKDKVVMHSQTAQAIITKLSSMREVSSHMVHQLTWLFDDLSQDNSGSERSLRAQCRQYKSEILQLSRHLVMCSICLDNAAEVSQTNRSLMSTFCGHIFCDYCLKKTIDMQSLEDNEYPSPPWCPRCRQILQPLRDSNLAHALFF